MTRTLALLAATTFFLYTSDVCAQYPFGPGYATGGFGFPYRGGHLQLGGFYRASSLYYSGGVMMIAPVVTVIQPRLIDPAPPQPQYNLSGIDLDVESPDKLFPPGTAPKREPGPERLRAPRPVAVKRPTPPAPPKLPPAPAVKPKPRPKPPLDDLWQPQPGALAEGRRLIELGRRAFHAADYGIARFRFRQAKDIDPMNARAWFLLAQAQLAAAEYDAAERAIHEGLKLDPAWPTRGFRPAGELYAEHPEDWRELRRRLDNALKRTPDSVKLLFLRGYVAWFDGQREQAVAWFVKARVRAADRHDLDLFLKHAPRPAIAAS